jgi:hypothetical protein
MLYPRQTTLALRHNPEAPFPECERDQLRWRAADRFDPS